MSAYASPIPSVQSVSERSVNTPLGDVQTPKQLSLLSMPSHENLLTPSGMLGPFPLASPNSGVSTLRGSVGSKFTTLRSKMPANATVVGGVSKAPSLLSVPTSTSEKTVMAPRVQNLINVIQDANIRLTESMFKKDSSSGVMSVANEQEYGFSKNILSLTYLMKIPCKGFVLPTVLHLIAWNLYGEENPRHLASMSVREVVLFMARQRKQEKILNGKVNLGLYFSACLASVERIASIRKDFADSLIDPQGTSYVAMGSDNYLCEGNRRDGHNCYGAALTHYATCATLYASYGTSRASINFINNTSI